MTINRRTFVLSSMAGMSMAGIGRAASRPPSQQIHSGIELSDPTEFSASDLSRAIYQRKISCRDTMEAYLEKIARLNPTYNAIISLRDSRDLLDEASAADRALDKGEYWGWMHGMPHAAKDLTEVKGMVNSAGSPILKDNVSQKDSIPMARIRAQGAIFIGKTNVPEFGLGSQSYNTVYGTTGNAYNPALTAGGSSGGAACALATRMVPVADGSDMMGSLRNPAAFNNVIGFRPSQGRVPEEDSDLFYQQLGYSGPMGRNVADTIKLMSTMSGFDPRVPLSFMEDVVPVSNKSLKNFKVAWMGDYNGYLTTEPGVIDLCEDALKALSGHGTIVENTVPDYDMARLWQTWLTLRHWGVASWARPLYENPETRALLKPELVWETEGGLSISGEDVIRAGKARSDWYRACHKLFEQHDFLVLPSAQVFPFDKEITWPRSIGSKKMDTYHRWMEVVIGGTLLGNPVVNLPVGFDSQGRPMGIQVIGPRGADHKVLEFALAYEASVDHLNRRPEMTL
jgi:amidase